MHIIHNYLYMYGCILNRTNGGHSFYDYGSCYVINAIRCNYLCTYKMYIYIVKFLFFRDDHANQEGMGLWVLKKKLLTAPHRRTELFYIDRAYMKFKSFPRHKKYTWSTFIDNFHLLWWANWYLLLLVHPSHTIRATYTLGWTRTRYIVNSRISMKIS